jgi:hypothetical protein
MHRFVRDWDAVVADGPYDLLLASEVFEHFTCPREQIRPLGAVLRRGSAFAFVTTGLYLPGRVGPDWHYLAPQSGQHVSFYSLEALARVGELLGGMELRRLGGDWEWLFVRRAPGSPRRLWDRAMTSVLRAAIQSGLVRRII